MPRTAIVRTILAATIGLGALLVATPAAIASPATPVSAVALDNGCCQVSVAGVPGQLSIAGPASGFTATFVNNGQQSISTLQVVFTFTGNQLAGGQIDLERRTNNGSWQRLGFGKRNGQLTAIDSRFRFGQPIGTGQNVVLAYRIAFTRNAHPGQILLGISVFGRISGDGGHGGDNQQLATAPQQRINVVGGAATPTPTPTHTATPTPTPTDTTIPTPTDTTQVVPVPSAPTIAGDTTDTGDGTSSFMWIAYTVGGLLLLAGIGVIGTMLWKRGPQIVETDWQEPGDPYDTDAQSGSTYGGTVYGTPTQSYPTQPGPRHGLDSTRQMPGV